MKHLWAGEAVTFHGAYTSVTNGRMGFLPYQAPHPPLEMGAQSEGATRRAARLTDGVFFGPQVAWRDIAGLARVFRDARGARGAATPATSASPLADRRPRRRGAGSAREYREALKMYGLAMRVGRLSSCAQTDVPMTRDGDGSPEDCVEAIARAREMGLERIGFTIYSLPREVDARIDYMQMIAERVLRPAGALA